MTDERLARQLDFILEIDKLKTVERRSYLLAADRRENAAEHSWHLAMLALVLVEHANQAVDVGRVLAMVLIHDIVEIDAGDTFVYDTVGAADKAERERAAADRLFGLLPPDQGVTLRAVWEEFEAASTPEARFAQALDRVMPVLHNVATSGRSWREHGITADRVLARNAHIAEGSRALWEEVRKRVAGALMRGDLQPGDGGQ